MMKRGRNHGGEADRSGDSVFASCAKLGINGCDSSRVLMKECPRPLLLACLPSQGKPFPLVSDLLGCCVGFRWVGGFGRLLRSPSCVETNSIV